MTWHHIWHVRIELTGKPPTDPGGKATAKLRAQLKSDLEKGIRDLTLSGGYSVRKVQVEFEEHTDSERH